jgi:hypothetical protein
MIHEHCAFVVTLRNYGGINSDVSLRVENEVVVRTSQTCIFYQANLASEMIQLDYRIQTVFVHTCMTVVEELVKLKRPFALDTVKLWYQFLHFANHSNFNRFKVLHSENYLSRSVSLEVTILVIGARACDVLGLYIQCTLCTFSKGSKLAHCVFFGFVGRLSAGNSHC